MAYNTVEIEFDESTKWNTDEVERWFSDTDITFIELREYFPTHVMCNYNGEETMFSDILEQFQDMGYVPLRWKYYEDSTWIEIIY